MLGFYFTRYGTSEGLPLLASNHPELVSVVITSLIQHLEQLRREAGDPEGAERFRQLLESLREGEDEDPR